jgi:chitin biosynthesis protein CHS5
VGAVPSSVEVPPPPPVEKERVGQAVEEVEEDVGKTDEMN